jgi:glycolate oxidase
MAAMVTFIAETAAAHDLLVGTFGHMGDGNLHRPSTDERNQNEMRRVHRALDAIVKKTLELGGRSPGAWRGSRQKPWLRQQMSDASFELMRR